MNDTNLLLRAYYEALHERLEADKELLATAIEKLLREESSKLSLEDFKGEKYEAYRDACLAFIDERIETYNPIGIQYTFDRIRSREAAELQLQLDWFDSRAEFETLLETVRAKTEAEMTEERLRALADEVIKEVGAFPDNSIKTTYEAEPGLQKLPGFSGASLRTFPPGCKPSSTNSLPPGVAILPFRCNAS